MVAENVEGQIFGAHGYFGITTILISVNIAHGEYVIE